MHARGRSVLEGFVRGPGPDADAAAERLIAGDAERITVASLAGRMQIGPEGEGATNQGLRDGCRSWLGEQDPGAWDVDLLWFNDDPRDAHEQRGFIGRLAAALDAGGGAILCLWPGTEFSDAATGEADENEPAIADRELADVAAAGPPQSSSPRASGASTAGGRGPQSPPDLPAAEFPSLPPPPDDDRPGLPGRRSSADDPATALARARDKRRAAESRLDRGDVATALSLATQGVELLVGPARESPECREEMERLVAVCAASEARLPATPTIRADRPTIYE
jgi:hypothetical protein